MNLIKLLTAITFTGLLAAPSFASNIIYIPSDQPVPENENSLVCVENDITTCTFTLIGDNESNRLIADDWKKIIKDSQTECVSKSDRIICTKKIGEEPASTKELRDKLYREIDLDLIRSYFPVNPVYKAVPDIRTATVEESFIITIARAISERTDNLAYTFIQSASDKPVSIEVKTHNYQELKFSLDIVALVILSVTAYFLLDAIFRILLKPTFRISRGDV